ncbi:hypothetical protein REPUB_Repub10bG0070600 [Reevesia pubescens]
MLPCASRVVGLGCCSLSLHYNQGQAFKYQYYNTNCPSGSHQLWQNSTSKISVSSMRIRYHCLDKKKLSSGHRKDIC